MSKFVMSNVERVEGGELAIRTGDIVNAVSFSSRDPNKPVNMDAVGTFTKCEHQNLTDGNPIMFPVIAFHKKEGGTLTWWYYPPTKEGGELRDLEYEWLMATFVKRIPRLL